MQVLPEMHLRREVHVYSPGGAVQVRRQLQPHELFVQTLKAPAADDAVQPPDVDAANANAHDAVAVPKKLPAVNNCTTRALNALVCNLSR